MFSDFWPLWVSTVAFHFLFYSCERGTFLVMSDMHWRSFDSHRLVSFRIRLNGGPNMFHAKMLLKYPLDWYSKIWWLWHLYIIANVTSSCRILLCPERRSYSGISLLELHDKQPSRVLKMTRSVRHGEAKPLRRGRNDRCAIDSE